MITTYAEWNPNPNTLPTHKAMSPGPVVDASPEVDAEQQLPSLDDATQKKIPQPQVPPHFLLLLF